MRYGRTLWVGLLILATVSAHGNGSPREIVPPFSSQPPGALPQGWQAKQLPKVQNQTQYLLVRESQRTVLKAVSVSSASALMARVEFDAARYPIMEWSWKVEATAPGAWGDKARDDFSARVFVIFAKPGGPFSYVGNFFGQLLGKSFSGTALNYVWANGVSAGAMAPSPYTDRVRMVAVEAGNERAGRWVSEKRNILADYRRAFGQDPGRVLGVAVMTDTDNTRSEAVAYYGDISFLPPSPAEAR